MAITAIRNRLAQLAELDSRREAIFRSLEERGLLTDELKNKLDAAQTMAVLEDIYLPFRPKRRTRATIARERGLEPLAQRIFAQDGIDPVNQDPLKESHAFINPEKEVNSAEEALAGARDIIAEWISEDAAARAAMREFFLHKAVFSSKIISGKEQEGIKYQDYYDWEESVNTAPSHRILAMRRAEKEGFIYASRIAPRAGSARAPGAVFHQRARVWPLNR